MKWFKRPTLDTTPPRTHAERLKEVQSFCALQQMRRALRRLNALDNYRRNMVGPPFDDVYNMYLRAADRALKSAARDDPDAMPYDEDLKLGLFWCTQEDIAKRIRDEKAKLL